MKPAIALMLTILAMPVWASQSNLYSQQAANGLLQLQELCRKAPMDVVTIALCWHNDTLTRPGTRHPNVRVLVSKDRRVSVSLSGEITLKADQPASGQEVPAVKVAPKEPDDIKNFRSIRTFRPAIENALLTLSTSDADFKAKAAEAKRHYQDAMAEVEKTILSFPKRKPGYTGEPMPKTTVYPYSKLPKAVQAQIDNAITLYWFSDQWDSAYRTLVWLEPKAVR